MLNPTPLEQYMLELVNRARVDPGAEADRHDVGLNDGISGTPISPASKPPLAFTPSLFQAADGYAERMIAEDFFAHTAPDGSTPSQRVFDAGWTSTTGSWRIGENISYYAGFDPSLPGDPATIDMQHRGLFRSSGHRRAILDEDYSEVGIGQAQGAFTTSSGTTYPYTSMITQNFADGSRSFLTGVVIDDADGDDFYDPGEGEGGVTITAVSLAGSYVTTTWSAGGYTLELPDGLYDVSFAGGPVASPINERVEIDGENVKLDAILGEVVNDGEIIGTNGQDSLTGGSADDSILGLGGADQLIGGSGDDLLSGGGGSDRLFGQQGSDKASGGGGQDEIYGGGGSDSLNGGGGSDTLSGGGGDDTLRVDTASDSLVELANQGNDTVLTVVDFNLPGNAGGTAEIEMLRLVKGRGNLNGAGNDLDNAIHGNSGHNALEGLAGDDQLFGKQGQDELYGGADDDWLHGHNGADSIYGGWGLDSLKGGDGGDSLFGDTGADSLFGGNGNDFLSGGLGEDRHKGGAGDDTFAFDSGLGGRQGEILDFSGAAEGDGDKILLAVPGNSGDWVGEASFSSAGGPEVRYEDLGKANGLLQVDRNGNGNANFEVTLKGISSVNQLTSTDFLFT